MFDWAKDAFNWGVGKISEALDFTGVIKLMILEVVQDVMSGAFKILQDTVLAYDNYKVLPHTDTLIETFSIIAIYLLAFLFIYRAFNMILQGGLASDVDFFNLFFNKVIPFIFLKLTH